MQINIQTKCIIRVVRSQVRIQPGWIWRQQIKRIRAVCHLTHTHMRPVGRARLKQQHSLAAKRDVVPIPEGDHSDTMSMFYGQQCHKNITTTWHLKSPKRQYVPRTEWQKTHLQCLSILWPLLIHRLCVIEHWMKKGLALDSDKKYLNRLCQISLQGVLYVVFEGTGASPRQINVQGTRHQLSKLAKAGRRNLCIMSKSLATLLTRILAAAKN